MQRDGVNCTTAADIPTEENLSTVFQQGWIKTHKEIQFNKILKDNLLNFIHLPPFQLHHRKVHKPHNRFKTVKFNILFCQMINKLSWN